MFRMGNLRFSAFSAAVSTLFFQNRPDFSSFTGNCFGIPPK